MICYIIHNILKNFTPNMEPQHRNLATFLTGVVSYTLFYSYVGTLGCEHTFLNVFFKYSIYIVMADAFAMAILYKHIFFREVEKTMCSKRTATNVETQIDTPLTKKINPVNEAFFPKPVFEKKRLPELLDKSSCNDNDSMEGFAKNSALGDYFTTNGESNKV